MVKKGPREIIDLACQGKRVRSQSKKGKRKKGDDKGDERKCNAKNYTTTKNKRNTADKLELKKFCKQCRAHTAHKEAKS